MLLSEFIEKYDGAPIELDKFAEAASKITDQEDFKEAAQDFLAAQENFYAWLTDYIELG